MISVWDIEAGDLMFEFSFPVNPHRWRPVIQRYYCRALAKMSPMDLQQIHRVNGVFAIDSQKNAACLTCQCRILPALFAV